MRATGVRSRRSGGAEHQDLVSPPDSPPGAVRPRRAALLFGAASALAAVLVCGSVAPEPGEPAWLRWLRVLADHPLRSAFASSLLFVALAPRARRPGGPSQPAL